MRDAPAGDVAAQLVARLTAAGLQVTAVTDHDLTAALGARTATLSLLNLRRTLAALPQPQHAAALDRFVRLTMVGLSGAGEGELLPRLCAPGDAHSLSAPWFAPVADGALWLTLVEDRGEVVRFVRAMDFVRWRLSVAAARARALENLIAWSAGVHPEPMGEGVFRFATGDGLDAARLLILSRWFSTPMLALPLSRDQLWVVADPARAASLHAEIGPLARQLPHAITSRLFRCEDGVLSPAARP